MCAAECRKRKKSKMYYAGGTEKKKKHLRELCPGMKGMIVTCNGMEKMCVTDAYRLFNEYADILYGPEVQGGASGTDLADLDFDDAVSQELKDLKEKPTHRRFQSVESGAKNVVFIQCEAPVCPDDLVHYMLTRIKAGGMPCTRHCQRVLPITHICRAFQNDIRKCASEMLAPHFHIPDTTKQFAVVYKARNNNEIIRDNVILWIAEAVNKGDTYNHKVDLSNPDLVILVEIIKSLCCMSVVKDFHELKKYNVQELTMAPAPSEGDNRVLSAQHVNKDPISETSSCPKD